MNWSVSMFTNISTGEQAPVKRNISPDGCLWAKLIDKDQTDSDYCQSWHCLPFVPATGYGTARTAFGEKDTL